MTIKKLSFFLISLFMAYPFVFSSELSALSGRDIMSKVDNRPNGDDRKTVMKMTLINKRGRKRERTMLTYSRDYGKDSKSLFYFRKPADVKGVGFLTWDYDNPSKDDDRWLYLPALKRVKRISGSSKNDYFMGSDFTYDDMGDRSVDEDTHKLLKEETLNGHECWVVESMPKEKGYMYSKMISWVRKDALVPIKVDYYDKRGMLLKKLHVSEIKKHQGFWTTFRFEMNNIQDRHKTILEIKEMRYNSNLRNSLFRVSTLQRGRIR